jgi:MarR family transcriptional regulator, multiple antibiotic resistance protein MarR
MAATPSASERRLSLLLLLVAASQRMGQLVGRELAAEGVEASDYALLSLIGVRGPVRLTEVAAELGMPLTTGSDAIRRLEAAGRVERLPNPEDGRSSLFRLSPKGDAEWRRGWPALRRIDARLLQELDDPAAVRTALEALGIAFEAALTEK